MVWHMQLALLLTFFISIPSQGSFVFSNKSHSSHSSLSHLTNCQELYRNGPLYVAIGNHTLPTHVRYHAPCHHAQQQSKPVMQQCHKQSTDCENKSRNCNPAQSPQKMRTPEALKNSSQAHQHHDTRQAQELLEVYEFLVNDDDESPEESIPYEQRIAALRQTVDIPQCIMQEKFALSSNIEHFLHDLDFPIEYFQKCDGNRYQLQLHKEVIALLDTSAFLRLNNKHNLVIQDLTHSIGQYASVGTAYNQSNQIIEATHIIDFCHLLVEFSQALVDGVFEGLCTAGKDGWHSLQKTAFKSIEACHHPIQTTCKVFAKVKAIGNKAVNAVDYGAKLVERLANRLACVMYEVGDLTITCVGDLQLADEIIAAGLQDIQQDISTTAELIKNITRYLATAIPAACTPDNVHFGSAFITEHGLKLATSHVCGKLYGRIASHALAYAATVGNKASQGATAGGKACFELTRKVSQNLAYGIADCLPAAATVKKITHYVLHEHELVPLLAKYADGITAPMCVVRAINKTRLKITEKFLKHIFGLESKLIGTVEKLSGLHHDYMSELESKGIIKLFNKTVCPHTGVITANVALPNGIVKNGKTTFFPPSWTREKVLEKICEGAANIVSTTREQRGNLSLDGKTIEGITIQYCFDHSGHLVSVFPTVKRL